MRQPPRLQPAPLTEAPGSPAPKGEDGAEGVRPITAPQPRPQVALPVPAEWLLRLARQVFRRWRADRCPQEAAALAFKTALSLVPLMAVASTLLKAAGKLDERGAILEFFAPNLFPAEEAREAVEQAILAFADNIASGVLGPLGLTVLIVVVFSLFHDIEVFWNRVWSAAKRRALLRSFAVFYLLATMVPFLVAISLYHTARFWRGGWTGFLLPFLSTFLALLAANKLLPSVRVMWRHAALGAGVSALLYEAAKGVFARYALAALGRYHSIYGAFGLVPLILVWIYVGWLCALLGVEVAHAAQRLDALEAGGGDRRRSLLGDGEEAWELATGATAARLMVEVARHFVHGAKALPAPKLAERLRLPEEVVQRVLGRLKERDLVMEVEGDAHGWMPSRPPQGIRLAEVFAAFRARGSGGASDRLSQLLTELEPSLSDKADVTLAELV
jgi:membrane protein